jgi:pimeloyl-ACP methyl ester carboxylesterase
VPIPPETQSSDSVADVARNGRVDLAYEVLGAANGNPLLLIMGMGSQLIEWPDDFCVELLSRGFAVARFDNRDSGRSTHFSAFGVPNPLSVLLRRPSAIPYRLVDMAQDAAAVLDQAGWRSAHVVGISMGGMIAQQLAICHPDRVRALTVISSTPWWRIGRQHAATTARAALAYWHPAHNRRQAGDRAVRMARLLASPGYPFDEEAARRLGEHAYDRDHDFSAIQRQNAAVIASSDLRPGLRTLPVPTLVLHGTADEVIRPAGGRAVADAVPQARLLLFPGMNHDLPRPLWPMIADEIASHAKRRTTRSDRR